MSVYIHATEEDLKLSGPHMWPKLTAELACDRFIHKRPELAFLETKRRLVAAHQDDVPGQIYIKITRTRTIDKKKVAYGSWAFYHRINWSDPEEDVRAFLSKLRAKAYQYFPDEPSLMEHIMLSFIDPDTRRVLLTLIERWT